MKKLLCLLLATLMILSMFAACSKPAKDSSTGDTSSSSSEKKEEPKKEETKKEEPKKEETKKEDKKEEPKKEEAKTEEKSLVNTDMMLPVTKEEVEMDILVRLTTDSAEPEEIWFWQYYQRKTNVKWDFVTVLDSAWGERKPIMMATGDYPGTILISDAFTNNEINNFGKDGTFIALNDYIDDYGYNMTQRFNEFPDAKAAMTCPDGNIYALAKIGPTYLGSINANINAVWLEKLGLDLPTTLDEFYDVLKAFKGMGDVNGDGIENEIPWGARWENGQNRGVILNALGLVTNGDIGNGVAIKPDGSACYFPMQQEYLKYIEYANKLYTEGLIDPDAFTITEEELVAKGQLQTIGFMAATPRYYTAEGGWEEYTYIIPMTENKGDRPVWFKSSYTYSPTFFVTDACEYPEVAVRWIDIFYTAEHSALAGYGPNRNDPDQMEGWEDTFIGWIAVDKPNENMIWTMGDPGTATYVSLSFSDEKGVPFRPADMSTVQLRNMYMLPWASAHIFMMGDEWFYTENGWAITAYTNDFSGTTEAIWRKSFVENAKEYQVLGYPSMVFYNDEESEFINENLTLITDYAKAEEAKFITGARPLSEFNDYIEQLKNLRADEYDEILYNYYERYKASLN
ncbi:MAG: extracellular solute-binding protein [Clostridiales bacterium]|nr:extracellular solute-binding protein [Clostridiales bacterium]